MVDSCPLLVTGATGYIGSRLIPLLLQRGYRVRAAVRRPEKLRGRPWADDPQLEIVTADMCDASAVRRAAEGCRMAYYLVHSMSARSRDFARTDRQAARHMREAADAAGLEQIVYLTGLGTDDPSEHLRSRAEVETILRTGRTPVTSLRAAMIIGSGSASFEILRYLVERLPLMVAPRWVDTPCQPIAVRNVLHYLAACLEVPEVRGGHFDIGQERIVTYRQLLQIYAEVAGLPRRCILGVPVLTPRLSAYWIHLVTPVPAALARPLAEGLRNEVICQETRIRRLIPQPLLDCREAIRLALARQRARTVDSWWFDAGPVPPVEWIQPGDPAWGGGTVYREDWSMVADADVGKLWRAIVRIGGGSGWYYANWLWSARGWIDRLVGGVGRSRGRRDADILHPGDVLDFWRVVRVTPGRELVLAAEMKLPGDAVLQLTLQPCDGGHVLRQVAHYRPRGLAGLLYWWLVTPLHKLVFRGMLRAIVRTAGGQVLRAPQREGRR